MFLSTEGFPQAHRILGIVNATSHLAMPTEAIDSFESMDQLFSTDVANMQVAPKFLVLTAYGTMIQFVK